MVKPTFKSEPNKKEDELKDGKLKEWGALPAKAVIDDNEKLKDKKDAEAVLGLDNLEIDVENSSRPFFAGKCCLIFGLFIILLIASCIIGSVLYFHGSKEGHKYKGWCSVKYDDDDDSREKGRHGAHHGGISSEERMSDVYPRPTPQPEGSRECSQETAIDVDEQYERIEKPEESDCERVTILHDYNTNISAYRLWSSDICYVTWIESDVLMNPAEFWRNMQDPYFLSQYFNEITLTYEAMLPAIPTPLHEQENGKYGEYLDGPKEFLCQGAQTYWIQKIPDEGVQDFLQLIDQVLQILAQLAAQTDVEQPDVIDNGGYGAFGGFGGEEPEWPWEDWMEHPPSAEPMEDEQYGRRKRRGAGKFNLNKFDLSASQQDAKEAALCLKTHFQQIKEIGRDSVVGAQIVPPCIMEKVKKWRPKLGQ